MATLAELLAHVPTGLDARDVEILLLHVTQKDRAFVRTWPQYKLMPWQAQHYHQLLARLVDGEPLPYVLGEQAFWTLMLHVTPATLIPRPDTERIVEVALDKINGRGGLSILDLGTGSGAIALALASECPMATVCAVDLSSAALDVAKRNAERHSLQRVQFLHGSWFEPVADSQRFDVIVSNPPYIDPADPHLDGLIHEPILALTAPDHGLADLRQIIGQAPQYLQHEGWLLVEHGHDQGAVVRMLFEQVGYQAVTTFQDYGANDRVTVGQYCS